MRNDNDNKINNFDYRNDRGKEFNSFLTREDALARDLAAGLNDEANLGFYLSVCRKYPEEILWMIYGRVKQFPERKIKKSKGALFNYLIQKYAKDNNRN